VDSPAGTLQQTIKRSSLYQRHFFLLPGTYRLNVIAKDLNGGNTNTYEVALHVPQFEPGKLAVSSIILADSIEKVPSRTIGTGQFVLGDSKVRPRIDGIFGRGEKMGIYFQVYGVEGEKPSGSIRYQVMRNGSSLPLIDFTEEIAKPDVTVERILPLASLETGDYTLKVVVTDRKSNQLVSPSTAFTVR
jgi:hypothetical protein